MHGPLRFALAFLAALIPSYAQPPVAPPPPPPAAPAFSVAPIPADPHELVTGAIHAATTPADRLAALNLLRAAADKAVSHKPQMKPFHFQASFTASGSVTYTGAGELSEIWMSGQSWRVTETLGNYSLDRIGYSGKSVDQKPVTFIPMRAQMLRNEIMWATAINAAGAQQIRTAAASWNGSPVTCILISGSGASALQSQTRLWVENEYCISNDSKLLQIHSMAPGTYAVFGYSRNLQFHGNATPDQIAIFVSGNQVIESNFSITDPAPADQSLLAVTPEMVAKGRPSVILSEGRIINLPSEGASGSVVEPVMLHVQLGPQGEVTDAELSAAANPSLVEQALSIVKNNHFGPPGGHLYVNVRFTPATR